MVFIYKVYINKKNLDLYVGLIYFKVMYGVFINIVIILGGYYLIWLGIFVINKIVGGVFVLFEFGGLNFFCYLGIWNLLYLLICWKFFFYL